METIRCTIVDNDPDSIELIKAMIPKIPGLAVEAEFTDALRGRDYLIEQGTDLLFLDIDMPGLKGTELLRLLDRPPVTVLCTGFADFALEAHELHVADYLLKPIPFDRFCKAVAYAKKQLGRPDFQQPEVMEDNVAIKVAEGNFSFLPTADINYLSAQGDDTFISLAPGSLRGEFLDDSKTEKFILAKAGLGRIAQNLPPKHFFQTHRSYIVAINRVAKVDKTAELITLSIPDGKTVSITHAKKKELLAMLGW
ncbi:LytR/AlgR family response regulator transcription factor [Parapedobacter sp. 2B3]|uniref:LytR/AlgR family response regulator transcription factor n=1 Tax=Parapedobacter sp. 2B3 TaxID=3342381 RepID=UPI0035B658B5